MDSGLRPCACGQRARHGGRYRDNVLRLVDFRGDGAASVSAKGVDASRLRLSGFYARGARREAVQGQVGTFALRGKDIEIGGVALSLLNGSFRGKAELRQLDRYSVTGDVSGVDTRRTAAMFYDQALPWDALVFGSVNLQGSLKRARDLRASGSLQLAPAPTGDPVHGEINVAYDASSGALDMGRSTVSLPHSRADFSGAINSELRVHLETTDLNDMLPVLGKSAADIPIKLSNGLILFDGIGGDLITRGLRATRAPPISLFRTSMADRWVRPSRAAPPIICAFGSFAARARFARSSRVGWG